VKEELVTGLLVKMASHRHLRQLLSRKVDDHVYRMIVDGDWPEPRMVQLRKYQFLSAMLACATRNLDRGIMSHEVLRKLARILVQDNFMRNAVEPTHAERRYQDQHGELPPTFIVLSPTQVCNLHCTGCYASSTARTAATLPYDTVDRITGETWDLFGSRFMTISGGEPFMYRSQGKTLLDLFEKYNDMFFEVFTNGTMIDDEVAARLGELTNVTPAISVEGMEAETDERRGPGTYRRILAAMDRLRRHGVPFGISVTATKRNASVLLTDRFYDYWFREEGATYMWQFQLMPIGRAEDAFELTVSPDQRLALLRMWEHLISEKKYCVADFWNSGVLSNGCIAYGRNGGYLYIDWDGKIMPCVFIPYYVDTVQDLYARGETLATALQSDFFKSGRQWQREYGLGHLHSPDNWLMPCSIRDNYRAFRDEILPAGILPENEEAAEALASEDYRRTLLAFDAELESLTHRIWNDEYLGFRGRHAAHGG